VSGLIHDPTAEPLTDSALLAKYIRITTKPVLDPYYPAKTAFKAPIVELPEYLAGLLSRE
jgi:hypothetical protein